MLVLSRHIEESICIGSDIIVTVVDIRGDKVRIGVDAPISVPVHRNEVFEAIERQGGMIVPTGIADKAIEAASTKICDMPEPYRSQALAAIREVLS